MIKIYKFITPSHYWWYSIIQGARNSFNSWDKMDTIDPEDFYNEDALPNISDFIGEKDKELLSHLADGDSSERKFLRQLPVLMSIAAPLYWWKEFDQYKIGTTSNSCSTMHTIMNAPFSKEQFSCDNMTEVGDVALEDVIVNLNDLRNRWKECDDYSIKKHLWYSIIQLLPESWMQKRTITLNYEVLKTIYRQRKNHKLYEWHDFCEYIKIMPLAKELLL